MRRSEAWWRLGALVGVAACVAPSDPLPDEVGFACADGVDNDADGLTDCDEPACAPLPLCTCGNGELDIGEVCDDGDDDDTDECLARCVLARCGDGAVLAGVEPCDDGNADATDACLPGCVPASCGDGFIQADVEACDDADADDTDGCVAGCELARCGDGLVRAGFEGCDDGNPDDTDACLTTCVLASCGDGVVQAPEVCDDDNADETDACISTCLAARCGDGHVQAGVEACDDGNEATDDGCPACEPASCGDGFVQAGVEACDDANAVAGDGCSPACELEMVNGGFEDPTPYLAWTGLHQQLGYGAWAIGTTGETYAFGTPVTDAFDGSVFDGLCLPIGFQVETVTVAAPVGDRVALTTQYSSDLHRLYQDVTVPIGATTLSWQMTFGTSYLSGPGDQRLAIGLRDPATDALLVELYSTDGAPSTQQAWASFSGDVSAYAGMAVRVDVTHDVIGDCFPAMFDDFRLQ